MITQFGSARQQFMVDLRKQVIGDLVHEKRMKLVESNYKVYLYFNNSSKLPRKSSLLQSKHLTSKTSEK